MPAIGHLGVADLNSYLCTNTGNVVAALNEFADKRRGKVSDNVIENSYESAPYNIVITERKSTRKEEEESTDPKEKYIGFATNVPDIDVSKYASRWGIETGIDR